MKPALLAALLIAASSPAYAAQDPAPVRQDSRIRIVAYDPNNVTVIYGAVGATLVLEFPASEKVDDVALSDSRYLQKATKGENIVYLKPMMALSAQPIFVKTRRADGMAKLYTMQFQTGEEAAKTYFLVRFTDPAGDRASRIAAAQAQARARRAVAAEQALSGSGMPRSAPKPSTVPFAGWNSDYSFSGNLITR